MASLLLGAPPMASTSFIASSFISFSKSKTLIRAPSSLSASTSTSLSTSRAPLIYCGRGDKKTAKGKRFRHSFGNSRPKDKKKGRGPPKVVAPPLPWKDKFDEEEKVEIEIDDSLE